MGKGASLGDWKKTTSFGNAAVELPSGERKDRHWSAHHGIKKGKKGTRWSFTEGSLGGLTKGLPKRNLEKQEAVREMSPV